MNRRAFLADSGRTIMFAIAAGAARTERSAALEQPQMRPEGLEQRVAAVIQTYDAQGNHRTGTEVDHTSAQWLASEVRNLGVRAALEPFTLSRVDPQLSYLRIGDRRIDGVPLFDAGLTAVEGVRSRLSAATQRSGWQKLRPSGSWTRSGTRSATKLRRRGRAATRRWSCSRAAVGQDSS